MTPKIVSAFFCRRCKVRRKPVHTSKFGTSWRCPKCAGVVIKRGVGVRGRGD